MAIEDRNLTAGTRLVAKFKKQAYVCMVEAVGDGIAFVVDGKRYKSPSSAGSAVMGGSACNGWRFWSLEGEAAPATDDAKPKTKAGKAKKKLIFRVPSQVGVVDGSTKFFCSACMKSFVVEGSETPEICPEGHRADDPELTTTMK